MTLQNEKFEELLAEQLAAELEPQRGKAAAAFEARLAAEKAEREAAERAAAEREAQEIAGGSKKRESWVRGEVSGRAMWFWAGVPSLMAASLAIVLTLQLVKGPTVEVPTYVAQTQSGSGGVQGGGSVVSVGVGGGDAIRLANGYEIKPERNEPPLRFPPTVQADPYRLP